MANVRKGENNSPVPAENSPSDGHSVRRENDHDKDHYGGEHERDPETLEYLRHLLPEVGALDFLLRRTPGDVVREEMGKQRLGEVHGEAAKEEEATRIELSIRTNMVGTKWTARTRMVPISVFLRRSLADSFGPSGTRGE